MPYIGPLNTSEGARKSDFDFDYLSQHPTHIKTGYLPSPPPNVKKTKWNLWIHWINWSETMWRRGEGFFACLPSLVKLMANIQDSGGKMFKVLLSQVLWSVQHTSLVRLWRLVWLVLIILKAPSGLTVRLRAVQSRKFSGLLAFFDSPHLIGFTFAV